MEDVLVVDINNMERSNILESILLVIQNEVDPIAMLTDEFFYKGDSPELTPIYNGVAMELAVCILENVPSNVDITDYIVSEYQQYPKKLILQRIV